MNSGRYVLVTFMMLSLSLGVQAKEQQKAPAAGSSATQPPPKTAEENKAQRNKNRGYVQPPTVQTQSEKKVALQELYTCAWKKEPRVERAEMFPTQEVCAGVVTCDLKAEKEVESALSDTRKSRLFARVVKENLEKLTDAEKMKALRTFLTLPEKGIRVGCRKSNAKDVCSTEEIKPELCLEEEVKHKYFASSAEWPQSYLNSPGDTCLVLGDSCPATTAPTRTTPGKRTGR
ncbi:MAG: hypothetical protein AB7F59_09040 [Bdellovibrionales bacterium]